MVESAMFSDSAKSNWRIFLRRLRSAQQTGCALGAPPFMKIRPVFVLRGCRGGPVCGTTSTIGDRLEVDFTAVILIPHSRLTRAGYRYHILSHPETGRTHGSVRRCLRR